MEMKKLYIGSELPPGPVVLWTGYKYLPYQIYGETLLYSIDWTEGPNAFFDFSIVYQWYMDRFWG